MHYLFTLLVVAQLGDMSARDVERLRMMTADMDKPLPKVKLELSREGVPGTIYYLTVGQKVPTRDRSAELWYRRMRTNGVNVFHYPEGWNNFNVGGYFWKNTDGKHIQLVLDPDEQLTYVMKGEGIVDADLYPYFMAADAWIQAHGHTGDRDQAVRATAYNLYIADREGHKPKMMVRGGIIR